MTYEEALQIRDEALIAHIEYGKQRLEHQDQRLHELMQERAVIAQQLEAMENAIETFSTRPWGKPS